MIETHSPGNPPRYGGYNGVMVRAVADLDSEAAIQWSRGWIAGQRNSPGFGELAAFYGNKAAWNWGDGMFWAWGEGRDAMNLTMPPEEGVAASSSTSTAASAGGTRSLRPHSGAVAGRAPRHRPRRPAGPSAEP
jgi:hypothetical protein